MFPRLTRHLFVIADALIHRSLRTNVAPIITIPRGASLPGRKRLTGPACGYVAELAGTNVQPSPPAMTHT
jgi:hypothetical protein